MSEPKSIPWLSGFEGPVSALRSPLEMEERIEWLEERQRDLSMKLRQGLLMIVAEIERQNGLQGR